MNSGLLKLGIGVALFFGLRTQSNPETTKSLLDIEYGFEHRIQTLSSLSKEENPSKEAIKYGLHGLLKLSSGDLLIIDSLLCVVDFTQPSYQKRLYIYNIKRNKLLYQTWVAHGKNSGMVLPSEFSNKRYSNKSSLGFYATANTYNGKHGLSLRLIGLEKGINDNALERAVVIHSAPYVSQKYIDRYGRIGRSFGCPALPLENYEEIINLIKEGCCFFIYANDPDFLKTSQLIG